MTSDATPPPQPRRAVALAGGRPAPVALVAVAALVAVVLVVLVVLLVVVFVGGRTGAGSSARQDAAPAPWSCTTIDLPVGAATGTTAREALDRYLSSIGASLDGWDLGEPNRFSHADGDHQDVASVHQDAPDRWSLVRMHRCARP